MVTYSVTSGGPAIEMYLKKFKKKYWYQYVLRVPQEESTHHAECPTKDMFTNLWKIVDPKDQKAVAIFKRPECL